MQAAERTFICQPDKLKQPTPTQNSWASYHEGIAPAWLGLSSAGGGPGPAARAVRAPQHQTGKLSLARKPRHRPQPPHPISLLSPLLRQQHPRAVGVTPAARTELLCCGAPLYRTPWPSLEPPQHPGATEPLAQLFPPQKKVSKPRGEGNGNLKGVSGANQPISVLGPISEKCSKRGSLGYSGGKAQDFSHN